MQRKTKNEKRFRKNVVIGAIIIALLIAMTILVMLIIGKNNSRGETEKIADSELARSMTYNQVQNGEEVTNCEYVNFDAFFLKDLNQDGIAEGVRGTCKEIGKSDVLYMNLNVLTNGYLKDAKIIINGDNFYFQSIIPKDDEIKENAIGTNIKEIKFNDIKNGTQKLLTGIVNSGSYMYSSDKNKALNNATTNMSAVNSVVLEGTHVSDDGTETQVYKKIDFNVDWYGTAKATINDWYLKKSYLNQELDLSEMINNEENEFTMNFDLLTSETENELLLKDVVAEVDVPEINGILPSKVEVEGTNIKYDYDEENKKIKIEKQAETDANNKIIAEAYDFKTGSTRYNKFKIKLVYPLEAYIALNEEILDVKVPVSVYYDGFNNTNKEFKNPYKSNVATDIISLLCKPKNTEGTITKSSVDVKVGKHVYMPERYIISKLLPLNLYNGYANENDSKDRYWVKWYAYVGTNDGQNTMILKEGEENSDTRVDKFKKNDGSSDNMEEYTNNVGIYFLNQIKVLGDDGYIRVYDDDTNELIHEFNKDDWNKYSSNSPYMYTVPVKHIRIETSEVNAENGMYVYNLKELDDEKITTDYTKEEFNQIKYIESHVIQNIGTTITEKDVDQANYEGTRAVATISCTPTAISTQAIEKNEKITIDATSAEYDGNRKWKNGIFLVKMPDEIIDVQVNSINISEKSVNILNYDILTIDNAKFIKIITQNDVEASYQINIDVAISADPRIPTTTKNIELYAINENAEEYYYSSNDIYDINENENTTENVNKSTTSLSMISPNSLLTNQSVREYDDKGSFAIAPEVAYVAKDVKKATIDLEIKNNYSNTISDVVILGKIPTVDNTYVISESNLGSEYSTTMGESGIIVPDDIKNYAEVYYSEKVNPTRELNNSENGWTTSPQDMSKVKSFMIILKDYVMPKDITHKFTYEIEFPNNLNYNQIAYSHHGVYFSLDTEEGKYKTQTEPNKLGFMVSKEYSLKLKKYKSGSDTTVQGAMYRIIEDGEDHGSTYMTNLNGELEFPNLHIGKTYIVREVKSPTEYALNTDEIKFNTNVDSNGKVNAEVISGNIRNNGSISLIDGESDKLFLEVEDEILASLKIIKTEKDTTNTLSNVRFNIYGDGEFSQGRTIVTGENGIAEVNGLNINTNYTIKETYAKGYYLAEDVVFNISRENNEYKINLVSGNVKNSSINIEDDTPIAKLNIENEKQPTYTLNITKVKKDDESTVLAGAQFKVIKDDKEIGNYITDSQGKITITNLYQYIDGKEDDCKYTLKEVKAPEGYSVIKPITFRAYIKDNRLEMEFDNDKEFKYTSDDNEVSLIIEDSAKFKLTKLDGTTKTP